MADATTTQATAAPAQPTAPAVRPTMEARAAALIKADADLKAATEARKAIHDEMAADLKGRGCTNGAKHAVAAGHTWHVLNGEVKWTPIA